jgi:2,4-dienoyl-CoA reductase (NADPH2)
MEAARALAASGHRVELFEAANRLGGQFRMACRIPGKEDFARTIAYFEAELARLGVSVSLGARVEDAAALDGFDGVVVATGVVPRAIDLPGAELPHVLSYAELLLDGRGGGDRGESVAIIGAGGIGLDVAHLLSHPVGGDPRAAFYEAYGLKRSGERTGRAPVAAVTLMRRGPRVGERIGPSTRWALLQALRRSGVEIMTGVSYERIEPGAVVVHDGEGRERSIPAEKVVVAAGQRPEASLAVMLEDAGRPHVVVGGASSATELDAERAFREGARAPRALEPALAAGC